MAIGTTKFNFGDGSGAREINPRSTAPVFSSSDSYAVDDYCFHDGFLYRCTTAHNGVWNAGHFQQVTVASELGEMRRDIETAGAVEIYVEGTSLIINTNITDGNEVAY